MTRCVFDDKRQRGVGPINARALEALLQVLLRLSARPGLPRDVAGHLRIGVVVQQRFKIVRTMSAKK